MGMNNCMLLINLYKHFILLEIRKIKIKRDENTILVLINIYLLYI